MNRLGPLACCALLAACGAPAPGETPAGPAPDPLDPGSQRSPFVGLIWLSTDPASPPGTIRIFLPDGSLVMDSCGETYRLARWRVIDDRRIEWEEDGMRIGAEVALSEPGRLTLRLQLVSEVRTETYRPAQVPWVCPDLARD